MKTRTTCVSHAILIGILQKRSWKKAFTPSGEKMANFAFILFWTILFSAWLEMLKWFFLSGFLSRTLTIYRTAEEGMGHSFIPLYHFHPVTNIQSFISTFHVRWLRCIFNCNACVYQAATRWDLPSYWFIIWFIDDVMYVCILDDLILGLYYSNLKPGTGNLNLHRLSSLHYKQND